MAECFRIEVQENYQIGGFLGTVAEKLQLSVFDSLFPLRNQNCFALNLPGSSDQKLVDRRALDDARLSGTSFRGSQRLQMLLDNLICSQCRTSGSCADCN